MDSSRSCCLCKQTPQDRRRLRKLHGESAITIKQHLQALSSLSLDNLQETGDSNASLCSICQGQIKAVANLEVKIAELQEIKKQLQHKVSKLRPLLGRRQCPTSHDQPPLKRVCPPLQMLNDQMQTSG